LKQDIFDIACLEYDTFGITFVLFSFNKPFLCHFPISLHICGFLVIDSTYE